MNKEYVRNGLEYYMKVEAIGGENFEYQMLGENRILNLLPVRVETLNQKKYLVYSVQDAKPFWMTVEKLWIDNRQFYSIVDSLLSTIEELNRYFLSADNLVLDPESLFIDVNCFRLHFLYVPGYGKDIRKQMMFLMEYLLERIHQKDMEAIMCAYGLHRLLKEKNIDFSEIRACLEYKKVDQEVQKEEEVVYEEKAFPGQGDERANLQEKKQEANENNYVSGGFLSWKTGACLFIFLGLAVGMIRVLFDIYQYGIEERKRNILLILLLCITADLLLLFRQWRKQREQRKLEQIFEKRDSLPVEKNGEYRGEPEGETTILAPIGQLGRGAVLQSIEPKRQPDILIIKTPFVLGSNGNETDYWMDLKQVSRIHAVIQKEGNSYEIRDLHSTNGTFVNGEKLGSEEQRLENGDEVMIADVRFRFWSEKKDDR